MATHGLRYYVVKICDILKPTTVNQHSRPTSLISRNLRLRYWWNYFKNLRKNDGQARVVEGVFIIRSEVDEVPKDGVLLLGRCIS